MPWPRRSEQTISASAGFHTSTAVTTDSSVGAPVSWLIGSATSATSHTGQCWIPATYSLSHAGQNTEAFPFSRNDR